MNSHSFGDGRRYTPPRKPTRGEQIHEERVKAAARIRRQNGLSLKWVQVWARACEEVPIPEEEEPEQESGCVNCGAPVNWEFAQPEHTCLECGLKVGVEDKPDLTDDYTERVDAVIKLGDRAARIVADEIHKVVSVAVTNGTEAALNEMKQRPELQGFDTTKIINILRRDVCWRLADMSNQAADGWDDLIFKRAIRFED